MHMTTFVCTIAMTDFISVDNVHLFALLQFTFFVCPIGTIPMLEGTSATLVTESSGYVGSRACVILDRLYLFIQFTILTFPAQTET